GDQEARDPVEPIIAAVAEGELERDLVIGANRSARAKPGARRGGVDAKRVDLCATQQPLRAGGRRHGQIRDHHPRQVPRGQQQHTHRLLGGAFEPRRTLRTRVARRALRGRERGLVRERVGLGGGGTEAHRADCTRIGRLKRSVEWPVALLPAGSAERPPAGFSLAPGCREPETRPSTEALYGRLARYFFVKALDRIVILRAFDPYW